MIGQWKSQSLMHFASWFFLFWPSLKPASFLIGKGCWAIPECGDPTLGCIFLILFLGVSIKTFPFSFFLWKNHGVFPRMCCSKRLRRDRGWSKNFPQVSLDAYKDEAERLVGHVWQGLYRLNWGGKTSIISILWLKVWKTAHDFRGNFACNLLFHFKNYMYRLWDLQLTYNPNFETIANLRRTYVLLSFWNLSLGVLNDLYLCLVPLRSTVGRWRVLQVGLGLLLLRFGQSSFVGGEDDKNLRMAIFLKRGTQIFLHFFSPVWWSGWGSKMLLISNNSNWKLTYIYIYVYIHHGLWKINEWKIFSFWKWFLLGGFSFAHFPRRATSKKPSLRSSKDKCGWTVGDISPELMFSLCFEILRNQSRASLGVFVNKNADMFFEVKFFSGMLPWSTFRCRVNW